MAKLEFGWRLPTFSTDGSPGVGVVADALVHLRQLEPHVDTVWVQDHLMPEATWTVCPAVTREAPALIVQNGCVAVPGPVSEHAAFPLST